MKLATTVLLAIVVMTMTLPAQILDQKNTAPLNVSYQLIAGIRTAQTFTVGVSGELTRVDANFGAPIAFGSGDIELRILPTNAAGVPSTNLNDALAFASLSSYPFGWNSFDLSGSGLQVQQGDVLAICLIATNTLFYGWMGGATLIPPAQLIAPTPRLLEISGSQRGVPLQRRATTPSVPMSNPRRTSLSTRRIRPISRLSMLIRPSRRRPRVPLGSRSSCSTIGRMTKRTSTNGGHCLAPLLRPRPAPPPMRQETPRGSISMSRGAEPATERLLDS